MVRFLTAGESHGGPLVLVLEGIPAGLPVALAAIDRDLGRQRGHCRDRGSIIEGERASVLSGVRAGETIGGPIAVVIEHDERKDVQRPLTASARETAGRVAAGAIARQLLLRAGIRVTSHVTAIGSVHLPDDGNRFELAVGLPDDSPLRCVDADAERRMTAEIDRARQAGDTLGGAFEVIAAGVPVGLGSYAQWDRKLDGRLAQAMLSIPGVNAAGIGLGAEAARRLGSRVHDEILPDPGGAAPIGMVRPTNNAGGLEGGVTNGEPLRVSASMRPCRCPRGTKASDATSAVDRGDVCAVPATTIVAEAMVALVLADALVERFGGDSMADLERALAESAEKLRRRFQAR